MCQKRKTQEKQKQDHSADTDAGVQCPDVWPKRPLIENKIVAVY